MATKLSPALMSDECDLECTHVPRSGVRQWIKGRISQKTSKYRYAGILTIEGQSLFFNGMDMLDRQDFIKIIPLEKIAHITLEMDVQHKSDSSGHFSAGEPSPLIIRYRQNGEEHTSYFATNFPGLKRRVDGNRFWYETLIRETIEVKINYLKRERELPSYPLTVEASQANANSPELVHA